MKIILSRKGFDSSHGGYPSPISTDGKMISLPIPQKSIIKYSDLLLDNRSYYDLMDTLRNEIKIDGKWQKINANSTCHLDPDLYKTIMDRPYNWKPSFGQRGSAESHLRNEGIQINDVFLFFGWFKEVEYSSFFKHKILSNRNGTHIIFGYLQIGDILYIDDDTQIPDWLNYHPHALNKNPQPNTIYISREFLSWDQQKPGAGVFYFNKDLVLTKPGYTRSKWDLPDSFKKLRISRHSQASWKDEGYFKSVDIGQDFVIEESPVVEDWAKRIINHHIL